jgi:hypothetical protein
MKSRRRVNSTVGAHTIIDRGFIGTRIAGNQRQSAVGHTKEDLCAGK